MLQLWNFSMKTKITSFLKVAVLSVIALATSTLAESDNGFYEKDHVRGFISIGADYRGMFDEFQKYVNKTAFYKGDHVYMAPGDSIEQTYRTSSMKYNSFDDYYLGLHVNVGAQYKQFLTWFDINFMPAQVSERSAKSYSASSDEGSSANFPLYDVKWFTYGADWMFGWKLFGENSFINIIPAVGVGFNLINFHLASDFSVSDGSSTVTARDRYYSSFASTLNTELEIRLEFDPISIGLYGGYRYVRYNELDIEGIDLSMDQADRNYDTDNCGETFFIGLRLTWTFLSDWQRKQIDKL